MQQRGLSLSTDRARAARAARGARQLQSGPSSVKWPFASFARELSAGRLSLKRLGAPLLFAPPVRRAPRTRGEAAAPSALRVLGTACSEFGARSEVGARALLELAGRVLALHEPAALAYLLVDGRLHGTKAMIEGGRKGCGGGAGGQVSVVRGPRSVVGAHHSLAARGGARGRTMGVTEIHRTTDD